MDDPASTSPRTPTTPTRRKGYGGDAKDSPRKRQCLWNSLLFKEINGPCSPTAAERRVMERQLTGKTPYSMSPIQNNKGPSYHIMANSRGKSIFEKLSGLEEEISSLKKENKNNFNEALQKSTKESDDRHQEVLSMMKDHAEEVQSNLQQFIEITTEFLALRRGELEFWRTNDKLRRRGDLVKARDEVAHGGQIIADLAMIDDLNVRTNATTSVYADCFRDAYGVTISQASLRLKDGPPPIRRLANILCSVRKLDAWNASVRQTDRETIESIATNLLARFLETDADAGQKFFVAGSGSRCYMRKCLICIKNGNS
ncbi:hypothetical protein Egran_06950 [Elaphomyces granulatus]|uniref:Uncharacterized protein n=1 Tax=Elaphomyces granulatus TaxID=519963 RepID=A0A232LMB3_9EURO|nr:hypothetical protein Egran_06950 [Elaphomyces granulatus]